MADIATPSAATMSTIDAGSEPSQKPQKTKPEKPDEQKYKENLGKAQREHAAAQERVVRLSNPRVPHPQLQSNRLTVRRMPSRPRLISLNLRTKTPPRAKGSKSSRLSCNTYDTNNPPSRILAVLYKRRLQALMLD